MGLQDRSYYQDSYSSPWGESAFSGGTRSIITSLIIINVAIFILDIFTPIVSETAHWLSANMAMRPSEILSRPWQIWKFLSYGFAHASINSKDSFFHVGGNMLVLFFLGRPIETRLGRDEFLKFYLVALLVSGLGFFLINATSAGGGVVGASGAVTAVIALFIFYYPQSTLLLFGVIPMKTWILGVIVVGMDLLRSLDPESQIAWEAHLSGFAFGFAYYRWKLNFDWIRLERIKKIFSGRPSLKIHQPNNAKSEKLRQEGDAILKKINDHGEESLTARERRVLKKYSQQLRNERG